MLRAFIIGALWGMFVPVLLLWVLNMTFRADIEYTWGSWLVSLSSCVLFALGVRACKRTS